MVRIGRESVSLPPTATTGQVIPLGQSCERGINSKLDILKSRELAQRVVEVLEPQFLLGQDSAESALFGRSLNARDIEE